jgi:hypothetical protein
MNLGRMEEKHDGLEDRVDRMEIRMERKE